jgi:hypothetical protein
LDVCSTRRAESFTSVQCGAKTHAGVPIQGGL